MKTAPLNPAGMFLINQKSFPSLGILCLSWYMMRTGYAVAANDLEGRENAYK